MKNRPKKGGLFAFGKDEVRVAFVEALDAVRITTPHSNILIDGIENVADGLTQAYREAHDAGDEAVAHTVNTIRRDVEEVINER